MDGGGNDVLICDQGTYPGCDKCKEMGASKLPVCLKIVQDTLSTFTKLQDRFASVGVKEVVRGRAAHGRQVALPFRRYGARIQGTRRLLRSG
jgi:hypothetical protein